LENFGNVRVPHPGVFLAKSAHGIDNAGDIGFFEFRRVRKLLKTKCDVFGVGATKNKECASDRKTMG
jgi:hypothetical protein